MKPMRLQFPKKKAEVFSYKNLLLTALSALLALFTMLLSYIHWLPMHNVQFSVSSSGAGNESFDLGEVRILYILADDEMITLESYAYNGWQYAGSLVTRQVGVVSFDLPARRYVEFSLQRGQHCGIAAVTLNGETLEHDLSADSDSIQEVIRTSVNSFLSARNIALGLFSFIVIYSLSHTMFGKHFQKRWQELPTLADMVIIIGIPVAVILAMMMSEVSPLSRMWASKNDISGFTAAARLYAMGRVPYKEIWEHKGPMIFFVNALGHRLWYPYGVWFFELTLHVAGFFTCYYMLKLKFSKSISLLATVMAIGVFAVLQDDGGNVESWSLPFIFAAGYIFTLAFKNNLVVPKRHVVLCGAFCAIVFLFRANNPILWVAAIPVLVVNQIYRKKYNLLLKQMGWFCLGFMGIVLPLCLYFLAINALREMFDATILFNIAYSRTGNTNLLAQVYASFRLFEILRAVFPYLDIIIAIGFAYPTILLLNQLHYKKKHQVNESFNYELSFLIFQLASYVCFILFVPMSNRTYRHYLILAVPVIVAIFAYVLKLLCDISFRILCKSKITSSNLQIFATTGILALFCFYLVSPLYIITVEVSLSDRRSFSERNLEHVAVANYITVNTQENDRYGFWGHDHTITNIIRGRLPSSRFFYASTYAIMRPTHKHEVDNFKIYMQEIVDSNPTFFVREYYQMLPDLENYLEAYYQPVSLFESYSYVRLYERNSKAIEGEGL